MKKQKVEKEINDWMNWLSSRTRVKIDIIRKIWLKNEQEAKNFRLHKNLNPEEMINYR